MTLLIWIYLLCAGIPYVIDAGDKLANNHTPRAGGRARGGGNSGGRGGGRRSRREVLHLAGLFPISVGGVGKGVLPAVQLAMDHVNRNKNILRKFKLTMTWNDTEVSPPTWLNFYFNFSVHDQISSQWSLKRINSFQKPSCPIQRLNLGDYAHKTWRNWPQIQCDQIQTSI